MFEQFDDKRAQNGIGAALYVKSATETLYSLALPLEGIPMVKGAPESIEYDITTSLVKGKIPGKTALEDKEVSFMAHRDSFLRLDDLIGQELEFLAVNADYTGWKYIGEINYRQEDASSGEAAKGTITITPKSADTTPISDVRDLLKPTVKFLNAVPAKLDLETATAAVNIVFETNPSGATLSAGTNQEGGFTAVFGTAPNANKLTITGINTGETVKYGIITITASKTGYASWKTTIAVSVPIPVPAGS